MEWIKENWLWLFYALISAFVSWGIFDALRQKAKELKLVQKHHAEKLIDWAFDGLVRFVEVLGKNAGLSGKQQAERAQSDAKELFPKMSEREISRRVAAAYLRMKEKK